MKITHCFLLLFSLSVLSSCATIVSKKIYPVMLSSVPDGAEFSITNKAGAEVFKGQTPSTVNLKAGAGFFKKEKYQIKFWKKGFDSKMIPLECKVDGWYAGNILFGGFIGLLIVDPATGAMYKLETDKVNVKLDSVQVSIPSKQFAIYSINEIPHSWKAYLQEVK